MIEDIKKAMKEKRALFGIRECVKDIGRAEKIFLSSDARQETWSKIKDIINSAKANVNCEMLGMGKEEISKKLELNFSCEVFSVCQKPISRGNKKEKSWGKDAKKEKSISGKRNKEEGKIEDKPKN